MAQASLKDTLLVTTEADLNSVSSVASKTSDKSSSKTTRGSGSSKLSLKDMDKRISLMELNMNTSFNRIMESLDKFTPEHTGGTCTSPRAETRERNGASTGRRIFDNFTAEHTGSTCTSPRAEAREGNSAPTGRRRSIISLNNGIDEDIVQEDALSLHPRDKEIQELYGLDDGSQARSVTSSVSNESGTCRKYKQYTNPDTPKMLGDLFGQDSITENISSDSGLTLDESQINMLNKSWRAQAPERVSSYKEEYRVCFPVHEQAASLLQVPGLDDLLEPMLAKRHGPKICKPWGKSRQLATQPLKAIETLGYQGQLAARMNIIALAYLQQGLGSLLGTLQEKDGNIDRAIQNVRDLYEMSNKALDQAGRAGAFHHMIRRKAAVSDSGLNTLKDLHSKVMFLPLTGEGVFGSGLQDKLKCRKEQKEQLTDLVPEFFGNKAPKRKSQDFENRATNKQPRLDSSGYTRYSGYKPRGRQSSYPRGTNSRYDYKNSSAGANKFRDKDTPAQSFRIPKKQ